MSTPHVSASGFKDWLNCKYSLYLRMKFSEMGIPSDEMKAGTVTHSAIEKYWDNYDAGMDHIREMSARMEVGKFLPVMLKNFDTFYTKLMPLLKSTDVIEHKFKWVDASGLTITGKWDRISDHAIYDWKTSPRPPLTINNDPQFIIYFNIYRQIRGITPRVFYASVSRGKLIEFIPNEVLIKHLFEAVIPMMVDDMEQNNFPRDGLYKKFSCQYCTYRNFCHTSLGLIGE
jgi:hypothetical protein